MSKNLTREYEEKLVKEFFYWLGGVVREECHVSMLSDSYLEEFFKTRNIQKVTCPWCKGEIPVDVQKTFYNSVGDPEVRCPHCCSKVGVQQDEIKLREGVFLLSWLCEENGKEHVYGKPSGRYRFCTRCEHAEKVEGDEEVEE